MCRSSLLILLIASFCWSASAAEPTCVDIKVLAKTSASLIGTSVATHGCLVNSPHGSFIEPCGSNDWHELTPVSDPNYLVGAAFGELGIDFSYNVEGDFIGVIVEETSNWPEPGQKRIAIRLDSLANSKPYEP